MRNQTLAGQWPCTEPTVDPELWFEEGNNQGLEAQLMCATCPVREACLEEALVTRAEGIWGGTTTRERRQILKRRAAGGQAAA